MPSPGDVEEQIYKGLRLARQGEVQVAFYGGTFTALPLETQRSYLGAVKPFLEGGRVHSVRVSTRPDAIDREVIEVLKEGGVRTVELGVQSMIPEVLEKSRRGYGPEAVRRSSSLLKEEGFELGIQIMLGLPGDTPGRFMETVREVIALGPDFVRIYPTLVIKGTELEGWFLEGRYRPLPLGEAVALCAQAVEAFEGAGVKVIRIGLQSTRELEESVVAGPYHPAFGQLVRSRVLGERVRQALKGVKGQRVIIEVNPRDLADLYGQKGENLRALRNRFPDLEIAVKGDPAVQRGRVRVEVA